VREGAIRVPERPAAPINFRATIYLSVNRLEEISYYSDNGFVRLPTINTKVNYASETIGIKMNHCGSDAAFRCRLIWVRTGRKSGTQQNFQELENVHLY
jgi:hypothetical protein